MALHARHLAVVGLGLMGGSMALALRGYAGTITGIEFNPETREYALAQKIVDQATDDLKEGVNDADVVVLAAPVAIVAICAGASARICARIPWSSTSAAPKRTFVRRWRICRLASRRLAGIR